jgi:hypothetical protein
MNRITRMLTITGLGLFAGITIGAGPAMAATNTAGTPAKPGDRVVNYYDTYAQCEIAGRIGERFGRWDDFDCYPVHGDYALVVDYNDWHGHDFPWRDRDRGHFPFDRFHGDHHGDHGDHGDHHGDHGDHGGDHGGGHHGGGHHGG